MPTDEKNKELGRLELSVDVASKMEFFLHVLTNTNITTPDGRKMTLQAFHAHEVMAYDNMDKARETDVENEF